MYDFVLHLPVRVLQVSSGSFSRFFYNVLIICEEHDTTRHRRSENIDFRPVTLFCFHFSIPTCSGPSSWFLRSLRFMELWLVEF